MRRIIKNGLIKKEKISIQKINGKKSGLRRKKIMIRSKKPRLKNGEEMKMKNGMKNGVRFLWEIKKRNGLINGPLI